MEGWAWDWADRIRKVRRVAGLSQHQMSRVCGVRVTTWSAWESGRNVPRGGERARVAGVLSREFGVCPDWLTAPDQQFSPLLPRMDSNHQPPDWRSDAARKSWWRTGFHDPDPPECVLRHSLTGSCCTSHRSELIITSPVRPATGNCSACRGGVMALPVGWQGAVNDWCRWLTVAGRSPRTIRTRRGHVEAVARYSATRHPGEINIDTLIAVFAARDYSLEHRRGAKTSLTQFFAWCVDHGVCQNNPALALPHIPEDKPRPKPAPDWLWDEVLAVAPPREKLMIRLAGELGLRREEICRVHSDDVLWDGQGFALRVHGKGGKQRVVPISDGGLGEQLQRCRGWVFPSVDRWGNRIADHLSADRVGRLVSDLLGPGWSCHKLRHRFATRGYAGTRNLRGVQVALGHASVATTQRYTAVVAEDVRAVVEAAAS